MAQLRRRSDEIAELGVRVRLVSFELPAVARRWRRENASRFTLLLDPDRALYRAYGLERSWRHSLGPRTLWTYAKALFDRGRRRSGGGQRRSSDGRRGSGERRQAQKGGDWRQLGGDFVIDGRGIIRLARPSREAADRPRWDEIAATLRRARTGVDERNRPRR